jgi:hypothetical protein
MLAPRERPPENLRKATAGSPIVESLAAPPAPGASKRLTLRVAGRTVSRRAVCFARSPPVSGDVGPSGWTPGRSSLAAGLDAVQRNEGQTTIAGRHGTRRRDSGQFSPPDTWRELFPGQSTARRADLQGNRPALRNRERHDPGAVCRRGGPYAVSGWERQTGHRGRGEP